MAEIQLHSVWKNKRPPYWNASSLYDFDQITVICVLFCIASIGHPRQINDVVYTPFRSWESLQATFRQHISIYDWDITVSGLEKQTSAILEFFFRLLLRQYRSNWRAIPHQTTKFRTNRPPAAEYWRHIQFQDGASGGLILPVSYLMMSFLSEGQSLSANEISSTYLNPRLRYCYFRFGKTNVRHIEILPFAILTRSQ